jgi:hypothetical protein
MIHQFSLLLRLPKKRKKLLLFGLLLAVYSYFLFKFFNEKARFGIQEGLLRPENAINIPTIISIRFVIKVLEKYTPWEFKCRHQAWIARVLLKKYLIPYSVYVGFKKNHQGQIEGHAWTIAQNIMVSGFCDTNEYTVQAKYIG